MEGGHHILPPVGPGTNALEVLAITSFYDVGMNGLEPLRASEMLATLSLEGETFAPIDLATARRASADYVRAYHAFDGKTEDAPWDWPKTDRDLQIIQEEQVRSIEKAMGVAGS